MRTLLHQIKIPILTTLRRRVHTTLRTVYLRLHHANTMLRGLQNAPLAGLALSSQDSQLAKIVAGVG
jgi:hypothetical protein